MFCKKSGEACQEARSGALPDGPLRVSARKACRCARIKRSVFYYQSIRDPLTALRLRTRELAHARVRFGYRRILVLLRREGWDVGKKRLYRIYREEGLALRRKRPWRHVSAAHLSSGEQQVGRTSFGAWTSSATSLPTAGVFAP